VFPPSAAAAEPIVGLSCTASGALWIITESNKVGLQPRARADRQVFSRAGVGADEAEGRRWVAAPGLPAGADDAADTGGCVSVFPDGSGVWAVDSSGGASCWSGGWSYTENCVIVV
jgi:hypothetical protein